MAINQAPTNSTLETIQTKVRRLTRSPSESQLTTPDLNQYINTSVLYDFPEMIRLFNLRRNFHFYTQPNVAEYGSSTNPNDPLYDFTNRYITVHPPVFVAGIQIQYTQSQSEFFSYWPENQYETTVGQGDGTSLTFTGTLSTFPVLRDRVNFTYQDSLGNGVTLYDIPDTGTTLTGKLFQSGQPVDPLDPYGTINYITGAFTLDLLTPPAANQPVHAQTWPYRPAIPTVMLFFDGKFQLRPVPDQPYRIQMEVYAQPVQLLASDTVPELSEWWQFISYLASKKIFEDRMDLESVQLIMPELKNQERLCLRRTLVQQSNERASTIYNFGNSTQGQRNNNYWGTF